MRRQQNDRFSGQDRNAYWNRTDEHFGGMNRHNDFDHNFSRVDTNFRERDDRESREWANNFPDRMTGRGDMSANSQSTERTGHYGKGPKGWKRSDVRVTEEVSESLYRNSAVDATEIEVSAKDGLVTLRGTVDSRDAKRTAEKCAEAISGVVDVQNELRVRSSSPLTIPAAGSGDRLS